MANEDLLSFDDQVSLWGKIASQRMIKALTQMGIRDSGGLQKSIEHQINKAGGDVTVAMFKFLQYGRFVDMGTGRGIARGAKGTTSFTMYRNDSGTLKASVNRKPKPWYSRTMYREIKILSEKLLANMDEKVMDTIQARLRRINNHSSNATS